MQTEPESDFSIEYPEWNTRIKKINTVLKYFGIAPSYYYDNSPYLAKNPRELRTIINMHFQEYYKTCRTIHKIFKQECLIPHIAPDQNIYDTTLYRKHTTIDWCPELGLYSFFYKIEKQFRIIIPEEKASELNTLRKWCNYIATTKEITIPQNTK